MRNCEKTGQIEKGFFMGLLISPCDAAGAEKMF
jgi:hypothetical protein